MVEYKKESVNDIFRKINSLNEISENSTKEDNEKQRKLFKKITFDEEGNSEVEEVTDKKDFMTYAKEAIGMQRLEVKFKKLDERAVVPTYAHDGDVGMDLTAIEVEYNAEMDCYLYHTGLAFETDKHYGIFLFPRRSNRKTEAYLCNHVGIADSAIYRGEIIFCFKNRTSLRQLALEERVTTFFNAITDGLPVETANVKGIEAWKNAFNDTMLFAPYKVGDRIGQMVVLPYPNVRLNERKHLSETERGDGAFGSTDEKK